MLLSQYSTVFSQQWLKDNKTFQFHPKMSSQIESVLASMQFGAIRNNLNGLGKNVPIGNGDLQVITPLCTAPFGISRRQNKDGTESVSMALRPVSESSKYMQLLREMDQKVLAYAHENQQEFFGTTGKSFEVIADRYYSLIKNTNSTFPAHFEAKMKFNKDGTPTFTLFDKENSIVQDVAKYSCVTAKICYPSLWVSNTGFGVNTKLIDATISPPVQNNIMAFAIVDDE